MFEELTPVPADLLLTAAVAGYFVDLSSALRGIGVITVAIALSNLPLPVMQEEFRLILPRSFSALVFGLLLGIVEGRCSLVTLSLYRPLVTVGRNVHVLLRHNGASPCSLEPMILRILSATKYGVRSID